MGGGESAVLPSISTAQVPHVPSPRQLIRRALPLCGLTRPLRRQAVRRISPSVAEKEMSGFAEAERKVTVCSFRQAAPYTPTRLAQYCHYDGACKPDA